MKKTIKLKAKVFGKECKLELMEYQDKYKKQWKKNFDSWKDLYDAMKSDGVRTPNIPEGISESAFCLFTGSMRLVTLQGKSSSSFDTFNVKKGRAEQVKATTIEKDLTSFGPRSVWDDLYFLDFYKEGKLDGSFDVYLIPNKLIEQAQVSKAQTLAEQQKEKRRPRISVKRVIIKANNIKPLAKDVKVWES